MTTNLAAIAGFGSVSPYGAFAGLIPNRPLDPTAISAWPTAASRRAYLVEPFRPASIIPGLKTRRLDRLSTWALVAASLAIQDAGIDLSQVDRSRVAVLFATYFGCVELTQSFLQSAASNGWSAADPITFPETLANAPASHVALFHGFRGPNVTIGGTSFAGESAILQAASLLRHGQADLVIVLSGDTLTEPIYQWYEASDLLGPACYKSEGWTGDPGFVPSEGVAALVLELSDERKQRRLYARLRSGQWAPGKKPLEPVRAMLGGAVPTLTICAGDGSPCSPSPITSLARDIVGHSGVIMPPQRVAAGLVHTGALLHLIMGLSNLPEGGEALLLATSGDSGFAALLLELS